MWWWTQPQCLRALLKYLQANIDKVQCQALHKTWRWSACWPFTSLFIFLILVCHLEKNSLWVTIIEWLFCFFIHRLNKILMVAFCSCLSSVARRLSGGAERHARRSGWDGAAGVRPAQRQSRTDARVEEERHYARPGQPAPAAQFAAANRWWRQFVDQRRAATGRGSIPVHCAKHGRDSRKCLRQVDRSRWVRCQGNYNVDDLFIKSHRLLILNSMS